MLERSKPLARHSSMPCGPVLSIDGVGAYDHISRASMLSGLQHTPSLTALLPFVAQFYAEPSTYVFYDAEGAAHEIAQGEGGEQGDPLMPALYALGQNPALLQAHAALTPGEDLYAYLDDIYVTCQPERAGPAFTALGTALWERANIRVHLGKTQAWNAAGEEPSALLDALPAAARADAWAGSWARPPAQQGITVLGTPLGHAAYIAGALGRVREKHDELLGRIPTVPHLQSAWLLLLLCAQPGAITWPPICRSVPGRSLLGLLGGRHAGDRRAAPARARADADGLGRSAGRLRRAFDAGGGPG